MSTANPSDQVSCDLAKLEPATAHATRCTPDRSKVTVSKLTADRHSPGHCIVARDGWPGTTKEDEKGEESRRVWARRGKALPSCNEMTSTSIVTGVLARQAADVKGAAGTSLSTST